MSYSRKFKLNAILYNKVVMYFQYSAEVFRRRYNNNGRNRNERS